MPTVRHRRFLNKYKSCRRCKRKKLLVSFSKDVSKKDKHSIYCKSCRSKIQRAKDPLKVKGYKAKYLARHPEKARDYMLRARYGITLKEFNIVFKKQDNSCKICHATESEGRNFAVDHCHGTGKLRGILCSRCNRGLGIFSDDPRKLKRAVAYLKGNF